MVCLSVTCNAKHFQTIYDLGSDVLLLPAGRRLFIVIAISFLYHLRGFSDEKNVEE